MAASLGTWHVGSPASDLGGDRGMPHVARPASPAEAEGGDVVSWFEAERSARSAVAGFAPPFVSPRIAPSGPMRRKVVFFAHGQQSLRTDTLPFKCAPFSSFVFEHFSHTQLPGVAPESALAPRCGSEAAAAVVDGTA